VPFRKTFSAEERDPHLLEKLKAEAPHIMAWMVEGCLEWQRRGLAVYRPWLPPRPPTIAPNRMW
jgi:phage/plasmid-associated DNA primase